MPLSNPINLHFKKYLIMNFKWYYFLFLSAFTILTFSYCDPPEDEEDNPPATTLSIGECGEFFSTGNYSASCFAEGNLLVPETFQESPAPTPRNCEYIFDNGDLFVELSEFTDASTAATLFSSSRESTLLFTTITDLNTIGDEAYLVEQNNDVTIFFRQDNVTGGLEIATFGDPLPAACQSRQQELTLIANEIINNL